jgi:hypothetical protein
MNVTDSLVDLSDVAQHASKFLQRWHSHVITAFREFILSDLEVYVSEFLARYTKIQLILYHIFLEECLGFFVVMTRGPIVLKPVRSLSFYRLPFDRSTNLQSLNKDHRLQCKGSIARKF